MSEGLLVTGKGSKELAGGKRLHVIVAIAYGKGVVLKVPYEKMNGNFFAEFIGKHINTCKNDRRLFLMDNDPSQTSKAARKSLEKVEDELHKIPARLPDLNPIENVFHLVKNSLENEAIANNIMSETFQDFTAQVLKSMKNLSTDVIDRTIPSLSS
ncbi:Transposable element Tcb1 transposase [Paramuricea clavata]|uniref:Transposable element Tcb1 transposase n=1 Tax=Paramuricea clavata TaxID=317549 RepID=A0A6S7K312_PARCT|nr:Transposable element Tcb1 transposase [Paramuricea clavata]